MMEHFSVISYFVVFTGIAVDCSRDDSFLKVIFESKQIIKSGNRSENNLKFTK